MENIAGRLVKNLSGELAYYSFKPSPLPPELEYDKELTAKLIEANNRVAALEALACRIPDISLFISMHVRKEALLSSQIEGTQCTLEDVLDTDVEANSNLDVKEVINYVNAISYAIDRMQTLPLCNRLIKETHEILLSNTRGDDKAPGEFRTSQNWIGGKGCTLKNARYIPPNVDDMLDAMSELEKFINTEDGIDPLIKAGLIHYQFETIHPFLDGNGRIGRLLIILYLIDKHVISKPALYISYFLKNNRIEYYDRMSEVRRKGDYKQWIMFFLDAVKESAEDALDTIDKLIALHNQTLGKIDSSKKNAIALLEYIEKHPIIETKATATALGISYNTVAKLISSFEDLGILKQTSKHGKAKIYSYADYIEVLKNGT